MTEQWPPQLWESLRAFLRAGKTGQIVLDVQDGQVYGYAVTELRQIGTLEATALRQCPQCQEGFSQRRRQAVYCSDACKSAAYRRRLQVVS